jgi:predicted alpha/beta-fold hydrolase
VTPEHDRVERFDMPDGDSVSIARMGRPRPDVPHLLVLHGLEGSIRATYAHGLLGQARQRGWTGDLMLFRTCDGDMNAAPRMYHSGETSDLDVVARRLVAVRHGQPIVVVGVSLGGNVLLKWLGELGPAGPSLVRRAVAVSVPLDLAAGSRQLERGILRFYARHFLATLKPKALAKARQFPGRIRIADVLAARTFWEFDDAVTAPLHGFRNAADYYAQSSSIAFLERIAVPTLILIAKDDPFVPRSTLTQAAEIVRRVPSLILEVTEKGGHVGWVSGSVMRPEYYMERRSVDFLENSV